ncbi:unnamed protein product [Effrenium voratum]|nr:unnamed protein product [Effrenium voratum]
MKFRRSKATAAPAKPSDGWGWIRGDDVEAAVAEQHRLGAQTALLGQGAEGFVDHEFPAQSRAIDGLVPPVKRGQEALLELLTAEKDEDSEEEDFVASAPRCFCGRRSRQGRVQLKMGAVARRPFFRCGTRSCRFFGFGELGPSREAVAVTWARLRTNVVSGLVVVGRDGFRPEDARLGQQSESLGDALFVEAVAVLAERPRALEKLLAYSWTASGCHEVRLCIAGLWRASFVDERFPMSASSAKNLHESLAFGRCAGNQLWIPLLEKAYAKAFSAYQFAFPGTALHTFLEELTGAVVERVVLQPSRSSRSRSKNQELDASELWEFLQQQQQRGSLMACSARNSLPGCSSVFAVLDVSARQVRLRNPRVASSGSYETALAVLRGRSAEASTYADGSFWVDFEDFPDSFSQVCVCHAASAGGNLAHMQTFEGDFTADNLGVRGCSLRVAGAGDLWISCLQPTPRGARLLQPSMGHVLNDLGLVAISEAGAVLAVAFGGATERFSCRLALQGALQLFPVSFRGWPGPVRLRLQSTEPLMVQPAEMPQGLWGLLWGLSRSPDSGALRGESSRLQIPGEGDLELLIWRLEGAALLVVDNPSSQAVVVQGLVKGNFVVTQTARGPQQGEWCEQNETSFAAGSVTQWRQYAVEDIVPAACRQLCSVHFAVNLDWDLEVLSVQASEAPAGMLGSRPKTHPFAPQFIATKRWATEKNLTSDAEDAELQLALALSLSETTTKRWARRNMRAQVAVAEVAEVTEATEVAAERCAVCIEPVVARAPVSCCAQLCRSCAQLWAEEQESQGLAAHEISCPLCSQRVPDSALPELLSAAALGRARARLNRASVPAVPDTLPSRTLARLGLKKCPGCGEGLQKESETCHKMICRSCRARFCFRCLARLEYFNCGCSGAEHRFVDPLDGRILTHQPETGR